MKEILKVVSKKLFICSFIVNTLFSVVDYGESFVLAFLGTGTLTLNKLIFVTVCIIIIEIIKLIVCKLGSYIDNINDIKTQNSIEIYYFKKMQSMSMEQISNIHTGYIHKLITNTARYFFEMTWNFEASVVPLFIGGISIMVMIFRQSISIGFICILISSIAVIANYKLTKKFQKYQKKSNEASSKYNAKLIDFIQNIIAVKKLNISKFCEDKIRENSNEYLIDAKISERKRSTSSGVFSGLMDLLYFVFFGCAIIMVSNGKDALPFLIFFITAMSKLYSNLRYLVKLIDSNERFNTAKKQLDEYFKDSKETKIINKFKEVNLSDVKFSYTKNSSEIFVPNFDLKKGDKISIMGESGQGKTTVMNILAGLYPLDNGKLLVDNKEVRNSRLDLVFVSQEVDLFDLSIRDNLCLGKKTSDKKIFNLLEEAGLMGWYNELPNGLDTMVGERGIKLSAGQKQRLNLIRGILIDKELYFFDEPTSNLDAISEEKIINMIDKYLNDKTYVIVTHRPKLNELCNRHYYMKNHIMEIQ